MVHWEIFEDEPMTETLSPSQPLRRAHLDKDRADHVISMIEQGFAGSLRGERINQPYSENSVAFLTAKAALG
jgi:hypothetical protein